MFQTKVVEEIKTHILCSVTFFSKIVPFVRYVENIVERGRPQMAIRRIRIACWIPKATETHSSCIILFLFPLQQWLHECAWMLRLVKFTYRLPVPLPAGNPLSQYRRMPRKSTHMPLWTCAPLARRLSPRLVTVLPADTPVETFRVLPVSPLKRPDCDSDPSPSSSENTWSSISTPPYAFKQWRLN